MHWMALFYSNSSLQIPSPDGPPSPVLSPSEGGSSSCSPSSLPPLHPSSPANRPRGSARSRAPHLTEHEQAEVEDCAHALRNDSQDGKGFKPAAGPACPPTQRRGSAEACTHRHNSHQALAQGGGERRGPGSVQVRLVPSCCGSPRLNVGCIERRLHPTTSSYCHV